MFAIYTQQSFSYIARTCSDVFAFAVAFEEACSLLGCDANSLIVTGSKHEKMIARQVALLVIRYECFVFCSIASRTRLRPFDDITAAQLQVMHAGRGLCGRPGSRRGLCGRPSSRRGHIYAHMYVVCTPPYKGVGRIFGRILHWSGTRLARYAVYIRIYTSTYIYGIRSSASLMYKASP